MIIYFDGASYGFVKDSNKLLLTYGVLLHNGSEEPVEIHGKHLVARHYKGNHEMIAFLESFKLLKEQNIDCKKVSFYTDSQEMVDAQFILHPENNKELRKDKFLVSLKHSLKLLKITDSLDEVIDCLLNSRFVKIKGHNNTVDNIRVDHLTRHAYKNTTPKKYDDFLKCTAINGVLFPFVEKKQKENKIKLD